MRTPTNCEATNWMRMRPLPGGSSMREPTSTAITSWMKVRNRLTSEPARIDRSVAMKLAPTSESHNVNRIDRDVNGRGEQLLLRAEVVMHQRRIHAGRGSHRTYRCVLNTVAGKQLPGAVQNPLAGVRAAGGPTRTLASGIGGRHVRMSSGEGSRQQGTVRRAQSPTRSRCSGQRQRS